MVLIIVFIGDTFLPEWADDYDRSAFGGIKKRYKYSDHGCYTTYDDIVNSELYKNLSEAEK